MATTLIRGWWALALRGIAALLLAVLLLTGTAVLAPLAVAVGFYLLVDGLFAVVGALCSGRRPQESRLGRWMFFVSGVGGLAISTPCLFFARGARIDLLPAGWAIVEGMCALGLRHELAHVAPDSLLPRNLKWVTQCGLHSRPTSSLLLTGGLYIMLGVLLCAQTITSATQPPLSVALLSLFMAAWGYLYLCTGLSLGVVHCSAASDAMEVGVG